MDGFSSFVAILDDVGSRGLILALYAGIYAGLLAIVVLTLNIALRRWITAGAMGLLWGIVLVRLLIPIAPSSTLSLQNLLPEMPENRTAVQEAVAVASVDDSTEPETEPDGTNWAAPTITAEMAAANSAFDLAAFVEILLPLVWLAGAVACLTVTFIANLRLLLCLHKGATCEDARLLELWKECCQKVGCRHMVPILHVDVIDQAAVAGLFRPKLLLPTTALQLTDEQLRMVMLHELGHVRRHDITANWLLALVHAIQWWNPIYWLAAARFRALREQACDAFALQKLDGDPARAYSELLLRLLERPGRSRWRVVLPASIVGFLSSFVRTRAVRNRLRAVSSAGHKRGRWHTACLAAILALVAICGLTDARMPAPPPEQPSEWLPRAALERDAWDVPHADDSEPEVPRTYTIKRVLERIDADRPTREEARGNLYWLTVHVLRGSSGRYHETTNEWAAERISIDGDTMAVTAPETVHAEIARMLSAWEQSGIGQTCIEVKFLTSDRDIATAAGVSWRYLETFSNDNNDELPRQWSSERPLVQASATVDDFLPTTAATLDERQTAALMNQAPGLHGTNVLQSPKVTVFNGQKVFICNYEQTPFVVGLQNLESGAQQPKIAVVDDGIKLNIRTIQSADAATIHVEGRVDVSKIEEVRTVSTVLDGKPATIQIPRVKRCRIDVSSTLPDGHSLLVGCIPTYEQKQFMYVLLTTKRISGTE